MPTWTEFDSVASLYRTPSPTSPLARQIALTKWQFRAGYAATLALLIGLLSIHITSDWRFLHEDTGMHYSIFAYSHLVEGPAVTGYHNAYRDPKTGQIVAQYLHHPPLLGLSLALAFKLLGTADFWVPRALSIAYHLVMVLGVGWLAWRLFDRRRSAVLLSGALFALLPMSFYLGKAVAYPTITMCFVTIGLIFHYLAVERILSGRNPWPLLFAALPVWFLAANAGWVAHFFLFSLGLQALVLAWLHPGKRRVFLALFVLVGTVSVTTLAITLWHIGLVGGQGMFAELNKALSTKVGSRRLSAEGWSYLFNGPTNILDLFRRYYALGPALLSLYWVYKAVRLHWRTPSMQQLWLFTFFFPGFLYVVVANEGVTIHVYYMYYLMPFVVLATVDMLYRIRDWLAALSIGRRRRFWHGFAVLAIVVTLVQSADLLHFRYSTDWTYATRRVYHLRTTFLVPPEQREAPDTKRY